MNPTRTLLHAITLITLASSALPLAAQSPAPQIQDPQAIYLSAPEFNAQADGLADDTAALQAAINKVQPTSGILFIPPGTYRLTKTINVPAGTRLIGLTDKNNKRPTFLLAANTPAFQNQPPKYMLDFLIDLPVAVTSFSGLSDINFEIAPGNPAAIALHFPSFNNSTASHLDFHLASGTAAIDGPPNVSQNLIITGGDYAILASSTQPTPPCLIIDSHFESQIKATIKTDSAAITLVRTQFQKSPTIIDITEKKWAGIWMKDCTAQDISGPALILGDQANERLKINIENLSFANTPTFAKLLPSGDTVAGYDDGSLYSAPTFTHGFKLNGVGDKGFMNTSCACEFGGISKIPAIPSDIPALPPRTAWVNVKSLGILGDGTTDDTAAIRAAIAQNKILYFPTGRYKITDTITLAADTTLIGLHPLTTQFILPDASPAFAGPADKPLLLAPTNSAPRVSGISINAGNNPHAIPLQWLANEKSFLADIIFPAPANSSNATPDTAPPSLLITNDAGGTFLNIHSANPLAQAALSISDTKTEGSLYAISLAGHATVEAAIKNTENWKIYALQTSQNRPQSSSPLSLDIEGSSSIIFANLSLARTTPGKTAIRIKTSSDLKFEGVQSTSPKPAPAFENTFLNADHNTTTPTPDIGWLLFGGG